MRCVLHVNSYSPCEVPQILSQALTELPAVGLLDPFSGYLCFSLKKCSSGALNINTNVQMMLHQGKSGVQCLAQHAWHVACRAKDWTRNLPLLDGRSTSREYKVDHLKNAPCRWTDETRNHRILEEVSCNHASCSSRYRTNIRVAMVTPVLKAEGMCSITSQKNMTDQFHWKTIFFIRWISILEDIPLINN